MNIKTLKSQLFNSNASSERIERGLKLIEAEVNKYEKLISESKNIREKIFSHYRETKRVKKEISGGTHWDYARSTSWSYYITQEFDKCFTQSLTPPPEVEYATEELWEIILIQSWISSSTRFNSPYTIAYIEQETRVYNLWKFMLFLRGSNGYSSDLITKIVRKILIHSTDERDVALIANNQHPFGGQQYWNIIYSPIQKQVDNEG